MCTDADREIDEIPADRLPHARGLRPGSRGSQPRVVFPVDFGALDLPHDHVSRLSGNVPDASWWEIDSRLQRIVLSAANGDRSNVSSDVYMDGDFPVFDKRFGSANIPPRVQCTENALVYYRDLWL